MGAFSNLFKIGDRQIPRVSILEAFAENADDQLTAPDIIRITRVSRRAVYLILNDLVDDGILVKMPKEKRSHAQGFMLNPNDVRAANLSLIESLLTTGAIEARIKEMAGIPSSVRAPMSVMEPERSILAGGPSSGWSDEQKICGPAPQQMAHLEEPPFPVLPAIGSSSVHSRPGWSTSSETSLATEACL